MTTTLMLKLLDFSQPFSIEYDASGIGIRVVLSQIKKLVVIFNKTSLNKCINEKELMALVLAIQHWRPFLQNP